MQYNMVYCTIYTSAVSFPNPEDAPVMNITFLSFMDNNQNIDSFVIVVSNSRAFMPFTELPLLFNRGLHTATE